MLKGFKSFAFVGLFFLFAFLIVSYGPDEFSLARLTGYVSFTSSPSMSSAYTDDDLSCSWSHDDTINITLIWFKDSVQFSNVTGNTSSVTSPQTLSSSNTSKGENWTCDINLFNATDNISEEISIMIINTRPTVPIIYYESASIGSSFELVEDINYSFVVNSTDLDGDTLSYGITEGTDPLTICSINSITGNLTCSVDHDNLNTSGEITKYQNTTFYSYDGSDSGGTEDKQIAFTLTPVNDAPVITISSYTTGVTVDTVYTQSFSVTDEESDSYNLSLAITKISGPGNPTYVNINETSEKIFFNTSDGTALVSDYGNYNLTILAFDSSNNSINATLVFNLVINSTNHQPNLTDVGAQSGVQGQPFIINLTAYDIDLNDSLTYSAIHADFSPFNNLNNYTVANVTYFNATLNITALTNNHIIYRNFTILVTDEALANDSIEINAALNNTNDAPVIYDNSSNSNNINYGSINITNLTGYRGANFRYYINYTDVDNLTYEGEQLYFGMNKSDPAFNLTNSGIFTFYSTSESYIGDHYINITLHDDGTSNYVAGTNLSYSKIMLLHILNNTQPYFVSGLDNTNCSEDIECYMVIIGNDTDVGDNVSYSVGSISVLNNFGNSSFNLSINSSTGIINYTPSQGDIGNYSISINLSDTRGAVIEDYFNLTINNTNDDPVLATPVVFPSTIYFGIPFSSTTVITATDEDLDLANSTEVINYTYSLSPNLSGVFILNISTGALTINTSVAACNQSYNITINVTDVSGAFDTADSTFNISNRGSSPEINAIYPYGNTSNNNTIVLGWNSSLGVTSGGVTTLVANEGAAIIFNHSSNDSEDSALTYNWSINDVIVNDSRIIEGGHTLNFTNGYFSDGSYNIEISINDSAFNFANWTWNLTIENVNRAPVLINSLPNFTGARSFSYIEITDYFTIPSISEEDQRFYDADFDLNNNSLLDLNETSNLNYTYSSGCDDYVIVTIVNDTITMLGELQGNCSMFFNATDSDGASVMSNEVFVNITSEYTIPEVQTITTSSSSGSSRSSVIPVDLSDSDDPVPLEIITAKSVVMYQDSTMVIPIELKNNWSTSLGELTVFVNTGEKGVNYTLSQDYFSTMPVGGKESLDLTIYNYREPGSYEIEVGVEIVSPEFEDSVVIIVNSLEESYKGETLETKLAFARDLLNSNDDCKELYEILTQAEDSLSSGDQKKTLAFLDLTINACKYMITNKDLIKNDKSGKINLIIDHNFLKDLLNNKRNLIIASIILVVIIALLIFFRKLKLKKIKIAESEGYNDTEKGNPGAEYINSSPQSAEKPF